MVLCGLLLQREILCHYRRGSGDLVLRPHALATLGFLDESMRQNPPAAILKARKTNLEILHLSAKCPEVSHFFLESLWVQPPRIRHLLKKHHESSACCSLRMVLSLLSDLF